MFICENYLFIDICDISVIFFICQDVYFHTNAFYIKFFNTFSLPDVESCVIPLLHIISLVSVSVLVNEDSEPNKVEFVLIAIPGEFTETLY